MNIYSLNLCFMTFAIVESGDRFCFACDCFYAHVYMCDCVVLFDTYPPQFTARLRRSHLESWRVGTCLDLCVSVSLDMFSHIVVLLFFIHTPPINSAPNLYRVCSECEDIQHYFSIMQSGDRLCETAATRPRAPHGARDQNQKKKTKIR